MNGNQGYVASSLSNQGDACRDKPRTPPEKTVLRYHSLKYYRRRAVRPIPNMPPANLFHLMVLSEEFVHDMMVT